MKRSDGRLVKGISPFMKIVPYVMWSRLDSMNSCKVEVACDGWDDYIRSRREQGVNIDYMTIVIASLVRTMALRPELNRFIMNGKIYTRPCIWVSFAIQRSMRPGHEEETTLKLRFDGTESIDQIAAGIQAEVDKNLGQGVSNDTDKIAQTIMSLPGWLIRSVVNILKWMDRHNMLPRSIIEASPFHTSFFITNLKSIGLSYLYHHCYEFGTTGIFLSLGKERRQVVADAKDNLSVQKMVTVGVVTDERFCDGLYFARSLRVMSRYLNDPASMEKPLEHKEEDID